MKSIRLSHSLVACLVLVVSSACGSVKAAGGTKVKAPSGGKAIGSGIGQPPETTPDQCSAPVVLTDAQRATCGSSCLSGKCKPAFDACSGVDAEGKTTAEDDCAGGVGNFGTREYCDLSCGGNPCPDSLTINTSSGAKDPCLSTVATCCLRYSNCLAAASTPQQAEACRTKAGAATANKFLQVFKCLQDGGTCSQNCDIPAVQNSAGSTPPAAGSCAKYAGANSCGDCVCSHGFLPDPSDTSEAGRCQSVFCESGKAPVGPSGPSALWSCE